MARRGFAALLLWLVACEGPPGPPGARGLAGEPDDGMDSGLPATCDWCVAGTRACTPDGTAIQVCEAEGDDGCGRWELDKTCPEACGRKAGETDELGNMRLGDVACVPAAIPLDAGVDTGADARSGDCRAGLACSGAYACNKANGLCERVWMGEATATLKNAADGVSHGFTSDVVTSGTCNGTAPTYWSTMKPWRCSMTARAQEWSMSSADGGLYRGSPVRSFTLDLNDLTAGDAGAPTCALDLDADRFTAVPGPTCIITLRTVDLKAGGVVDGLFSSTTMLRHMNESDAGSSINVAGSFRWQIPSK